MAFLPVWPQCTNARWNRCQEDLNSFPFGAQEETTRTPSYYVDEYYPAILEIQQPLPEWSKWHGSESSTLETDLYVWCYTLLVVHARNEWMSDWVLMCNQTTRMISNNVTFTNWSLWRAGRRSLHPWHLSQHTDNRDSRQTPQLLHQSTTDSQHYYILLSILCKSCSVSVGSRTTKL